MRTPLAHAARAARVLWLGAVAAALVGCGAGEPAAPPPGPPVPPPPPPATASAPAPSAGQRGAACSPSEPCAAGLFCSPMPGGYCTSFCGLVGTACDGACGETARAGEICFKPCSADADCRAAQGYVCDPDWKACMMPGSGALVPKTCPAGPGPARDSSFSPSQRLSTSALPGVFQFEPAATLTDDGGLVALFASRGGQMEPNILGLARVDAEGKATIDVPLPTDRPVHFDPWLARDRKGVVYAVWLGMVGRGEHQVVGLATSTDRGASWSKSIDARDPADCKGDEADCLDKPMVVVGPDPKKKGADVVYVLYSAGEVGLRVRASRDAGKTFGPANAALEGMYGNAAVGADGRLHVVTVNGGPKGGFGSTKHKIEYTVSSDGGASFAKPTVVSSPGESVPFFFSNPSIAVDDKRGVVYLAYARGSREGAWGIVITSMRGGKLGAVTRIEDGCAIHLVPNLAVDPTTGLLHVAWYDSAGAKGRFAHATCDVGATRCTGLGAINDVPFAALSTERHGPKWIGEYERLLVDDKRRLLHAVWTQPVDEGGKVVSRILHATAKLPAR